MFVVEGNPLPWLLSELSRWPPLKQLGISLPAKLASRYRSSDSTTRLLVGFELPGSDVRHVHPQGHSLIRKNLTQKLKIVPVEARSHLDAGLVVSSKTFSIRRIDFDRLSTFRASSD